LLWLFAVKLVELRRDWLVHVRANDRLVSDW